MKKLISIILTVILFSLSSFEVSAASETSLKNNEKKINYQIYSPQFPDAYIEQDFLDLSDVKLDLVNDELKINNLSSENNSQKLKSILNNDKSLENIIKKELENSEKNILGIVSATVYVEEKYTSDDNGQLICESSKILSKDDIDSSTPTIADSGSDSKGKLTINFVATSIYNPSHTITYGLNGDCSWSGMYAIANTKLQPAVGEDFIGFAWGGGFSRENPYISGQYDDGTNITFHSNAGSVANAASIWSFDELKRYGNTANYASEVLLNVDLYKYNLIGEDTSLMFNYIHTYQSHSGSISVNASIGGVGAGFSLTGVSKQWSLNVTLDGFGY